ncbi:MAG: peptide chain release factor 1 [Alphaproteobacteria bacterium]|nr:peptide chain release factor 1 [Alphaproteobacteria bacterium]NCQ87853.1 peptide chain release factor 1 [Alphaproteobacteria bacterium]NCT05639.1 peptide chain release factor 1 [Alphaproteobacteria bacterium]
MSFVDKLQPIKKRHAELSEALGQEGLTTKDLVQFSTEYAGLDPVVEAINKYENALSEQADLEEMLNDPEMKEMAQADMYRLEKLIPALEEEIKIALIPKDSADTKNAILEIRAGTGGDEAALFAADLFGMYKGYASKMGWRMEVMEASESDAGGYREIIAEIAGTDVFAKLKFESGVHRVQRVPKTETQGRVHTSAATVAVLPEAEDVDVNLVESDIRCDYYRSSGPGGQSVNTTDSAVRLTHEPTGIVVSIQDEKSQHKNKAKAMKILKTRVYDYERQKIDSERAADRKAQVGTGDRSERIRTYNYPQSRVSDHRINLTSHNLDGIIIGEGLDDIIDALIAEDQAAKLSNLDI